jgi:outer membrane protein
MKPQMGRILDDHLDDGPEGVATAVLLLAGAAHAQDYTSNAKGDLIVHLRLTQVAIDKDAAIVTAAGAASGLEAHVTNDVKPTLGFTYFLTDKVAVQAIVGTTQHDIRAPGTGASTPTSRRSFSTPTPRSTAGP